MTLGISEILSKANGIRAKKDKIQFLRDNYSDALRLVIQFAMHPNVKILLPEGEPPYTPSNLADSNYGMLYSQTRKLFMFCEGSNYSNLHPMKREQLFIELIETIHPNDAKLLIAAKDKIMPYSTLTKELIAEAIPNIFN